MPLSPDMAPPGERELPARIALAAGFQYVHEPLVSDDAAVPFLAGRDVIEHLTLGHLLARPRPLRAHQRRAGLRRRLAENVILVSSSADGLTSPRIAVPVRVVHDETDVGRLVCSPELRHVVTRATAKRVADRFQSPAETREALDATPEAGVGG